MSTWHQFPIIYNRHPAIRKWLLEHVGPAGSYYHNKGPWAWLVDDRGVYHVCIQDTRLALLYKLTWV